VTKVLVLQHKYPKKANVWLHVVTWSLYWQNCVYITRTARHSSSTDRQTSCGLIGLHVGYTTERYLQQLDIFFVVSLQISIRNLLCTVTRDLRFTSDLSFPHQAYDLERTGFENRKKFCSPICPYRLWGLPASALMMYLCSYQG